MASVIILFIRIYQWTLSPDHGLVRFLGVGLTCRYAETCSQFTIRAIQESGTLPGLARAIKRISTCHPFTRP